MGVLRNEGIDAEQIRIPQLGKAIEQLPRAAADIKDTGVTRQAVRPHERQFGVGLYSRQDSADRREQPCHRSVTLIHGEQDGNAPFETALEYWAMYPGWRYVAWPDEGELVAHVHWREVLALVETAFAPEPLAVQRKLPLPS